MKSIKKIGFILACIMLIESLMPVLNGISIIPKVSAEGETNPNILQLSLPGTAETANVEVVLTPPDWTEDPVNVKLTTEVTDYILQYKIGENGKWTDYEQPFEVESNCTIFARFRYDMPVGTEVFYIPDKVEEPITSYKDADSPNKPDNITTYNGDSDQEINQEQLNWVVLGMDKENPDHILITSEFPTNETLTLYRSSWI